jgi:hypothetical protein
MADMRRNWRTRVGVAALAVTLPVVLAACSSPSASPATTNPSSFGSSNGTWTVAVAAKAKGACEQGGGTSDECDCAVSYLEAHGYLAAGSAERQGIMQDATNACAGATEGTTTTSVPAPTTTSKPVLIPIQLIPPITTSLDWTGFLISPLGCQVVGASQVQVSGTGLVPSLAGRGQVSGEIEAWAVDQNGRVAYGQPSQIPDAAGPYSWTVNIPIITGAQIARCEAQGIDPDYSYTNPQ